MITALLTCGTARAEDPATVAAPPSPEAAAVAAVKPNLARVKTRPKWLSGPKSELPDSEKVLGHHGKVVVAGVLGEDGRITSAVISASSGAPSLDALALANAQASVFEPARDTEGKPVAIPISFPQEFYSYKTPDGGIFHYWCQQFVKDMDWWRATFPDAKWKSHELYVMMLGFTVAAAPGATPAEKFEAVKSAEFEDHWEASIRACRDAPRTLFRDIIFRWPLMSTSTK